MVTLGSSEVILKGAKVPGLRQSSATMPKRSVKASLCWEWEWETNLTCRYKEGQSFFQCPLWPHHGQSPGSGWGEGQYFAQCLVWLYLKQAPGGMCCYPARLKVGGGGLRAATKSWAFCWSQTSSQLLNTLNAIFTRSPWVIWGLPSACLSFLRISGKDWEIKWELRIIIPSLEDGSYAKSYHMLGLGI
jgi:hypothetical protein